MDTQIIKGPGERIRSMVYASLFSSLTAASSIFVIPLGPVPITLQVLFVLLSGGLLGPAWGVVSMILYILMGLIGLPVFSGGRAGIGHILGPTGGYLVGFVFSSFIAGLLTRSKRSLPIIFFGMMVSLLAIYCPGILWLSITARLPISKALAVGLIPFIPGDILKAIIASIVIAKKGHISKGNQ